MRPEVLDRRTRVLEPLDHHPLEALAQNRLDRALHAGRHLEEIRHRPHDARQRRRAPLLEHGAHARAVALAGAFERCERVEARPVGSQRNPRVRQRGLRLGQAPLVRRQSRRQSVALTRELAELRACHVTRLGEARAKRVDPRRLGFRLAELDRESLRAPAALRLTLSQRSRSWRPITSRRSTSRSRSPCTFWADWRRPESRWSLSWSRSRCCASCAASWAERVRSACSRSRRRPSSAASRSPSATRAMYSAATTTSERSRLVVWSALYCCAFFACRSSEASWRLTSSMTSRTRTRFCRAASSLPWVSLRCCL